MLVTEGKSLLPLIVSSRLPTDPPVRTLVLPSVAPKRSLTVGCRVRVIESLSLRASVASDESFRVNVYSPACSPVVVRVRVP